MGKLPFEGIRIVDFSWALAGPATTKHMALFGAEVVKIETRTRLDGTRLNGPYFEGRPGVNKSAYFANHNISKMSIRLDLAHPQAKEIVKQMVRVCDIVVESFSAGVLSRMGLDYPNLLELRPDLIMLSFSMQGQTGPFAPHLGFGRTLSGLVGIDNLTGFADSNPAGPNQPYTDLVVPWFGVTALIGALRRREKTGKGDYIDLSQLETSMHFVAPAVLDYSVNRVDETRQGNRVSYASPHGVYPCVSDIAQGRWVAIAVETDTHWSNLCNAMGQPELVTDSRFSTFVLRKRNEDTLDDIISRWTADQEVGAVATLLVRAEVPAAEVATGRTMLQDRQLAHREFLPTVVHPTIGPYHYNRTSFRASAMTPVERYAPQLGEHNGYVFQDLLGISSEDVEGLESQKIAN